jgi:homoserine/homoserine lactone efflux protein
VSLQAWLLFCLTETLLCLHPGPAVLLVVSISMTRGRAQAFAASLGVLAANALYFGVSATGLVALLNLSSRGFLAIRWAGAGYLIWLGGRMLLRAPRGDAGAGETAAPAARGQAIWQGFVAQAANPSLLVYFTAILPQFVDATAPLAGQVAILAVSSFAIELGVLWAYAALSHRASHRAAPRHRHLLERFAGALLIAAGAGLATIGMPAGN